MVRVEKEIRVHRDGRVVEAIALFNTGFRRSYFSMDLAGEMGYERYRRPKFTPLAVRGKYAKLIIDITV